MVSVSIPARLKDLYMHERKWWYGFVFKYTPVNFQIFITHVNLFIFLLKEKKTLQMAQWVTVPAANS